MPFGSHKITDLHLNCTSPRWMVHCYCRWQCRWLLSQWELLPPKWLLPTHTLLLWGRRRRDCRVYLRFPGFLFEMGCTIHIVTNNCVGYVSRLVWSTKRCTWHAIWLLYGINGCDVYTVESRSRNWFKCLEQWNHFCITSRFKISLEHIYRVAIMKNLKVITVTTIAFFL